MTVVKMKMVRLPCIDQLNPAGEMPIVIAANQDQLARAAELFDQPLGRFLRRAVVHEISQNNEPIRPIVA